MIQLTTPIRSSSRSRRPPLHLAWNQRVLCPTAVFAGTAYLALDVLMSTPHSVVIGARVELADEPGWRDIEVVVPRRACRGDHPSCAALQEAARHGLSRLQDAGCRAHLPVIRLRALIDGHWQALLEHGKAWAGPWGPMPVVHG